MTPQSILSYIRNKSQVTVNEMPDVYIYELMSSRYHGLWQEITLLDENYGSAFWDTDTLATVNQYVMKTPVEKGSLNVAEFGQLKIEKITIKYNDQQQYPVVAQKKDWQFMQFAKERYEVNQSVYNPFYIVSDKSVYIYPTPKETVVNGITMYGVQKPYNLNQYTTNISDILVEPEYHDLIALGTLIDVYRERQRFDVANESESYYDRQKKEMLKNISIRSLQPMRGNIPDLRTIDMISVRDRR